MDIEIIKEQFNDILEHLATDYIFELSEKTTPNPFGGNPETTVYLTDTKINGIPYKDKTFNWQRQVQSERDFKNSIKAYLFDILDGVSNL